jgi:predicted nucleotidyltransferase
LGVHAEIEKRREELIALCRQYDVARLEVFGSAARGIDFDPEKSDVDFLVEFKPESELSPLNRFFGPVEALEKLLGRRVDLVEASAIRNPYVRAGIERSRQVVYGT